MGASKFPYTSLRKSLRLLIEDPDPLEELENDISYVYSGYAPISVRLVQCVAQKGGVISNPAGEKDKKIAASDQTSGRTTGAGAAGEVPKVQAHPIVGWKGFEDVIASIPGETVDVVQKVPGASQNGAPTVSTLCKPLCSRLMSSCSSDMPFLLLSPRRLQLSCLGLFRTALATLFSIKLYSASKGTADDYSSVLPGWLHIYGDRRSSLGWKAEHR